MPVLVVANLVEPLYCRLTPVLLLIKPMLAVPVMTGEAAGAAALKAVLIASNSVLKSRPRITFEGSFAGKVSLAPKLVVMLYVILMIVSYESLLLFLKFSSAVSTCKFQGT